MSARFRCSALRPLSMVGLAISCWLTAVHPAQADTILDVSGTFDDNNSTPLTGTITLDEATGAIDGFDFDIPTMTIGSSTLAGALFTPATATVSFDNFGPAAFVNFQLNGAPPEGEELFLLIPPPTLPHTGGPLLQEVTFDDQDYHTGYQSGVQSNPFFELTGNGSITLAPTPEPSSYAFLGLSIAGLLLARRRIMRS
jgi:hypothetical protein